MIIPIRCFTCNYPISSKWSRYNKLTTNGIQPAIVFKELGVKRYCCKRMLLSHDEIIDRVIQHEQHFDYVREV
jgi:DNA-directed RNA polymerase subunit N